ncbi:hypothetical protein D3C76_1129580 [compost metagenome]
MRLVEVDVVGLQTAQRGFHGLFDVDGGEALVAVAHVHADLGGDDHLVALAGSLQPVADDGFRFAACMRGQPAGVDVCCVDAVQAGVQQRIQQAERGRFVGRPAEYIAAEYQGRNLQARLAKFA